MCGICGIWGAPDASAGDARVQGMLSTIVHRGPDGEGRLARPGVALGMRRLAIIDLAGGDQPIHNEDRTVGVVFNGEIYNFRELRVELERAGHVFATRSDTEVIVHGYEQWATTSSTGSRGCSRSRCSTRPATACWSFGTASARSPSTTPSTTVSW